MIEGVNKERAKRSKLGRESWDKKTDAQKKDIIAKGSDAIRRSSREGSKLEKFILNELTKRKYKVQFHREQ